MTGILISVNTSTTKKFNGLSLFWLSCEYHSLTLREWALFQTASAISN